MRSRHLFQRLRPLSTALAITCLGPCVLQAQDAIDRPSLDQLRAELGGATTLPQVTAVAMTWRARAPRAVLHLGDSYVDLRRAVLADTRGLFVSTWDAFDQEVRRHPDWPYARLGLALTALEIYTRQYPLPASYDGTTGGTHYDGYELEMTRALRTQGGFPPAVDWVVTSMLVSGDYRQPGAIIDALQYVADSTQVNDPRVELVLARVELMRGAPVQSLRRIGAYLREGGDTGTAFLEHASVLASMGSSDSAAALYLAGAKLRSAEVKNAYQLDIEWIASPEELVQFTRLPDDSVGGFIAAFWRRRDAQQFAPTGRELQEHLARSAYVIQHFPPPDPAYRALFLPYGVTSCAQVATGATDGEAARAGAPRGSPPLVDNRAVLYMRYGAALRPVGTVALRDATGDGNPALAYRYDPGLMSGSNIMSTGNGTSVPVTPVAGHAALAPFQPTPLAPIPFDRDITWVYVVQGQMSEAVLGRCQH